jgi:hypothetical protein
MIATLQTSPQRVLVLKGTYRIRLQVIGPFTVRLATSRDEMLRNSQGLNDGLQINQATGIYKDWWSGELWMSASVANSQVLIIITSGSEQTPTCV